MSSEQTKQRDQSEAPFADGDWKTSLDFCRGIHRINSGNLQYLSVLLADDYDPDSFLTSSVYYQAVGQEGLWIYKEGNSFIPFCRDTSDPDKLLVFPPRGIPSIHILRNFLAKVPYPPSGLRLVRLKPAIHLTQLLKQSKIPLKSMQLKPVADIGDNLTYRIYKTRDLINSIALWRTTMQPGTSQSQNISSVRIASDHQDFKKVAIKPHKGIFNSDELGIPKSVTDFAIREHTGLVFFVDNKIVGVAAWDVSNASCPTANLWFSAADTQLHQNHSMLETAAKAILFAGTEFINLEGCGANMSSQLCRGLIPEFSGALQSIDILMRDKFRDRLMERPVSSAQRGAFLSDLSFP